MFIVKKLQASPKFKDVRETILKSPQYAYVLSVLFHVSGPPHTQLTFGIVVVKLSEMVYRGPRFIE